MSYNEPIHYKPEPISLAYAEALGLVQLTEWEALSTPVRKSIYGEGISYHAWCVLDAAKLVANGVHQAHPVVRHRAGGEKKVAVFRTPW